MINNLYQEVILDHGKSPRNFYKMALFTNYAKGYNALCGDRIEIYLKINSDLIEEISFQGQGCIICMASSSLLTEMVFKKTISSCNDLIFAVYQMFVSGEVSELTLRKLIILKNIIKFPMRVKCATLSWHVLEAALKQDQNIITSDK